MGVRSGLRGVALCVMLLMGWVAAQDRPHLAYVYPPGAQAGKTVSILVGGQNLEGVTNIRITGTGIRAKLVSYNRELDRQLINNLDNRKINLEDRIKKASDEERPGLEKQLERILKTLSYQEPEPSDPVLAKYMKSMVPKKQLNAQLTDRVRFELTLDGDCAPGPREIRLYTPKGYSDPITFVVGQFPSTVEKEPNDEFAKATDAGFVPGVWFGQVLPGESDCFKFSARRGQNLIFKVQARDLIPYLADAVPGWFQPVIAIYDDKGKELAYCDDTLGQPDPILAFTVPGDGDYYFEIHDSIWRGREDFVYRVTVGEVPHVWGVFPLGGTFGKSTRVTLSGNNLPVGSVDLSGKFPEDGTVVFDRIGETPVNPFRFQLDQDLEEVMEPAGGASAAAIKVPMNSAINGHIAKAGEVDQYELDLKTGDRVIAEVFARRLGSPLDSFLKVMDPQGKMVTNNDDYADPSFGLVAFQADSRVDFTAQADGPYKLVLRDTQGKGGDLFAYRLRVSPPRPDFRVRLTPSSAGIGRGGSEPFQLHIVRRDGFTNEVRIALTNAPDGFKVSPDRAKPMMSPVKITLTAPRDFLGETNLELFATAMINGKAVRRKVEPAEDMMQAFFYRHLVPAQEWLLAWAPKEKGGAAAAPPWVVQLKPATLMIAKYLMKALAVPADKMDAAVKAYVAEREAGFARMAGLGGEENGAEKIKKVLLDNIKGMETVLAKVTDEETAKKAPEIIGPLFGEVEREVAYLLDIGVNREKIEDGLPALCTYTRSVNEEVYQKIAGKKMSREEGAEHIKKLRALTVAELAPFLGEDIAQRWANQPVATIAKRS